MFSRQILFFRSSIFNYRQIHISKPMNQTLNRPFTLTKRNRKDKIDSGALFLLVCFFFKVFKNT